MLEYDDVMNKQRELIYTQRRTVLTGADVHNDIMDMLETLVESIISVYCPDGVLPEEWDVAAMTEYFGKIFLPKGMTLFEGMDISDLSREAIKQHVLDIAHEQYKKKEEEIEAVGQSMREIERILLLRVVDQKWMAHIDAMDQLRQGIGLRAYGQRDPIIEYRREGFDMFEEMIHEIQQDTVTMLFHVKVTTRPQRREAPKEIAPVPKKGIRFQRQQGGPQRALPVRQRQKIQKLLRKGAGFIGATVLQLDEIKQKLAEIKAQAKEAETALGIDALEKELASLRGQMEAPDFWTNVEQAGKVTKKAKPIEDKLDQFKKTKKAP